MPFAYKDIHNQKAYCPCYNDKDSNDCNEVERVSLVLLDKKDASIEVNKAQLDKTECQRLEYEDGVFEL